MGIKVDYLKKISRKWSTTPRNSRKTTKPLLTEFELKTSWSLMLTKSNRPWMTKKSKTRSPTKTKKAVREKADEVISWMDNSSAASKEEYESMKKELEAVCNPIMTKMYQAAGGAPGGMPGGMPGGAPNAGAGAAPSGGASAGGPTIEEVD